MTACNTGYVHWVSWVQLQYYNLATITSVNSLVNSSGVGLIVPADEDGEPHYLQKDVLHNISCSVALAVTFA